MEKKENTKDFFEDIKNEFKEIGGKVNRLFEEVVKGKKNDKPFDVNADVFETVDGLVFELDLPGFKKENVKVQIRENNLIVRGTRERAEDKDTVKFHINERSFAAFERTFILPQGIEPTTIKAKFDSGILRITMPVEENPFNEKDISID